MIITISDGIKSHDYYDVPNKVAKALITLLDECGNQETQIITAESEPQERNYKE